MAVEMPSYAIGLTYELRSSYLARGYSREATAEFPEDETIEAIEKSLQELGHKTERVGDLYELVKRLALIDPLNTAERPWDLVFNICEGVPNCGRGKGSSRGRGGQVPALLEAYGIRYTFADAATLDLVLDKGVTKAFLHYHGVPTSPFAIIPGHYVPDEFKNVKVQEVLIDDFKRKGIAPSVKKPLFVKPALEGSSKGINENSRVISIEEMWATVSALRAQLPQQDIIVEQYADGREFTVSVIGTGEKATVLGANEYLFLPTTNGAIGYHSYDARFESPTGVFKEVLVDPKTDSEVAAACDVALRAYRAVECRDLGRIDIRSIGHGKDAQPVVLEVNAIAGLQPIHSLPKTVEWMGMGYRELIRRVIENAMDIRVRED